MNTQSIVLVWQIKQFGIPCLDKHVKRLLRQTSRLRTPDLVQSLLGFALRRLRQLVKHVSGLVQPATLLARLAKDFLQRSPKAHRTVADGQLWRVHPNPVQNHPLRKDL